PRPRGVGRGTHAGGEIDEIPFGFTAAGSGIEVARSGGQRNRMPTTAAATVSPSPSRSSARAAIVAHDLEGLRRGLVEMVPELRGRAYRLGGYPTVADDLVQDTIERALKFASQYERGTNLRAWVYQILFSVFITRYRRSRRERNALRSLA